MFNVQRSRDHNKVAWRALVHIGDVTERSKFVCNLCIEHGKSFIDNVTAQEATSEVAAIAEDIEELPCEDEELLDNVISKLSAKSEISPAVAGKINELVGVIGRNIVSKNIVKEYPSLQKKI